MYIAQAFLKICVGCVGCCDTIALNQHTQDCRIFGTLHTICVGVSVVSVSFYVFGNCLFNPAHFVRVLQWKDAKGVYSFPEVLLR